MSKMTPFGDRPSVVLIILISTRETGVLDGICAASNSAGLLGLPPGLIDDRIGVVLIWLPFGEKNVTSNC